VPSLPILNYQRQLSYLVLIAVTSLANPATSFGEMTITEWKAAGLLIKIK
jgi:mRNA interferase MazF